MARILFSSGKQRVFLKQVLGRMSAPSLRSLRQFGVSIPYSTLKKYYVEDKTLPQSLFLELCSLANLEPKHFSFKTLPDTWGQSKGGKKSKRRK